MWPDVGRHGVLVRVVAGGLIAIAPGSGAASAQQASAPPVVAPPAPMADVDPNDPLAALPDIGVEWPDLATAPGTPIAAHDPVATDFRYGWRIDGLDGIGGSLLQQRFRELSALAGDDDEEANAAQLDLRARQDAQLLVTLLKGAGYYDATVATNVDRRARRPVVVLSATPGPLYRFDAVTLAGVEAAGDKAASLRDAFSVRAGDAVNADAIAAAEAKLKTTVGQDGFPFAQVGAPEVVVDRETRTATLAMQVAPGNARRFGRITVNADNKVFGAAHVQDIARFKPGQPYQASDIEDLRRALVQTGLVSTAEVRPVPDADPNVVDVAVTLEPAPPRTIAGELGYGTGEGARAEVSWTHRNLFPPEGAVTLRGVAGTQEQLGQVTFRRNNFHQRDRVLTAQFAIASLRRQAFQANTITLSTALERQTNIFFQKKWIWSLGAELLASDERDVDLSTGLPRRRTFLIGALPTSLGYDGSDDLLNPTRGFRLSGRASPEVSLQNQVFGYTRLQLDASKYQPVGDSVVLAARTRLGTILGAPRDQIAPSRRFYAGGGASVRGYGFQAIGPRDVNNDPIGGRSLAEFSIETRVKTFGNFGIVPFLDGGTVYTTAFPGLGDFQYGAGVGVRYYSNFGPIRLDVGTPLNPKPGDSRIAVYVSLGQAF
ncbi:autotransporter assembly complex family protein [uncultured Sphingomonas sp.]|uniref:autotransporter assembly complex protein TamA n=1 Tax=uncultured Sphingomonas sp. TaxID=158754 RepID=UPI0025FDDF95|nr:BamA/TamA family outer membrane protein [uncultured Sphingomonas sp.]